MAHLGPGTEAPDSFLSNMTCCCDGAEHAAAARRYPNLAHPHYTGIGRRVVRYELGYPWTWDADLAVGFITVFFSSLLRASFYTLGGIKGGETDAVLGAGRGDGRLVISSNVLIRTRLELTGGSYACLYVRVACRREGTLLFIVRLGSWQEARRREAAFLCTPALVMRRERAALWPGWPSLTCRLQAVHPSRIVTEYKPHANALIGFNRHEYFTWQFICVGTKYALLLLPEDLLRNGHAANAAAMPQPWGSIGTYSTRKPILVSIPILLRRSWGLYELQWHLPSIRVYVCTTRLRTPVELASEQPDT